MKSHFKAALFLACFTLLFLGIGFFSKGKTIYSMSRGNYFFENSRNNLKLHTVIVKFENGKNITLEQQNGIWRIKEADDYFASPFEANALLKFISDTVIFRADKLNKTDKQQHLENTIKITCLDSDGNILDIAEIAPKKDTNRYHYALLNNNAYLYQLKGNFMPSPVLMDWVQMPFLQIQEDSIKRIKTDNFEVYRRFSDEALKSAEDNEPVMHIGQLLNNIKLLNAEEIKHITHFSPSEFQKIRHYKITLFNGLIYGVDLYKNTNDYWVNIHLNQELTASSEIVRLMKEQQMLYDGWYFKINNGKGHIIANFSL